MAKRARRGPCPTPHKDVFWTHRAALATAQVISKRMIREGKRFDPLYYYRCPCGALHTTRHEEHNGKPNLQLLIVPLALQEWARTGVLDDRDQLDATRSPAPARDDA